MGDENVFKRQPAECFFTPIQWSNKSRSVKDPLDQCNLVKILLSPECLTESGFQCRSAIFELSVSICYLTDLTEEMAPAYAETDENFDYMENVCTTGNTKCQGINQFVSEENKELINR